MRHRARYLSAAVYSFEEAPVPTRSLPSSSKQSRGSSLAYSMSSPTAGSESARWARRSARPLRLVSRARPVAGRHGTSFSSFPRLPLPHLAAIARHDAAAGPANAYLPLTGPPHAEQYLPIPFGPGIFPNRESIGAGFFLNRLAWPQGSWVWIPRGGPTRQEGERLRSYRRDDGCRAEQFDVRE